MTMNLLIALFMGCIAWVSYILTEAITDFVDKKTGMTSHKPDKFDVIWFTFIGALFGVYLARAFLGV